MTRTIEAGPHAEADYRRMVLEDDPHDRVLVENCHPPSWSNPNPSGTYNLVVIGAGTAGLVSAVGSAGLGARVAIIERALTGGDCLNVGCVPSKGVIRAGRAAYDVAEAGQYGVRIGGDVEVDFAAAMERMRRLRAKISPNDAVARMQSLGIDVFIGQGRFTSHRTIEVDGRTLTFDRAVVASGARAVEPDIPGLAEAGFLTNETVFRLTACPTRMAVIGAGPIGCELAQAFMRLGSRVTLVAKTPQIMPKEDRDAADIVQRQLEREGMEILTSARVVEARRDGHERVLVIEAPDGRIERRFDEVLVGVGRKPNLEGLGLEAAGIAFDRRGVTVDDSLRTTNKRVYAAGDICSSYKFTHAADAMARIVITNAFFRPFRSGRVSDLVIPWCTYTDPEVAHVGLTEHQAKERGIAAGVVTHHLADNDRAILDGDEEGFARVVYDTKSGRMIGGTIVARHAGEMIGELTLAIATKQKVSVLSSTIHPYPTQSEAVKRLGDLYMRGALTPKVKAIFDRWFRFRRR